MTLCRRLLVRQSTPVSIGTVPKSSTARGEALRNAILTPSRARSRYSRLRQRRFSPAWLHSPDTRSEAGALEAWTLQPPPPPRRAGFNYYAWRLSVDNVVTAKRRPLRVPSWPPVPPSFLPSFLAPALSLTRGACSLRLCQRRAGNALDVRSFRLPSLRANLPRHRTG